MQNIEFKAELREPELAVAQCKSLGASFVGELRQTDTYFRMAEGRLKRRQAPGEPTEWIYYTRPNIIQPRRSEYSIISDQQARLRWGTHSLHSWITVVKTRQLWMLDNVRIHLDEVDGLGSFIEFEAMMVGEEDSQRCRDLVQTLREQFGPILGEAIGVSYCDLMSQVTTPG